MNRSPLCSEWQNTRRQVRLLSWFVINLDSQVVWISQGNQGIPQLSLILLIFKSNYCKTARDLFSDLSVLSRPDTSWRVEKPFMVLDGYQAPAGCSFGRLWSSDLGRLLSRPPSYYDPATLPSRWMIAGISPEHANFWSTAPLWSLVTLQVSLLTVWQMSI